MAKIVDNWTTNPEYINLLKFLVKKTKNVKSPLSVWMLARKFKKETDAVSSDRAFYNRILNFLPKIHEMDHIDTDTKAKLMFAMSVPVDPNFLKKLKAEAEVTLDDQQRIINYKKKGECLVRRNTNVTSIGTVRRDEQMLEFLARKSTQVDSPICFSTFLREFKEETGVTEEIDSLAKRFRSLKKTIHESTYYDEKTKIRMMFVSGASVPDDFLEQIRKNALVEVDEYDRITKYKAKDGSLELTGGQSRSMKRVKRSNSRSATMVEEEDALTQRSGIVVTRSGRVSKKKISFGDDETDDNDRSLVKKERTSTSSSNRRSKKKISFGDDETDDIDRSSSEKKRTLTSSSKSSSNSFSTILQDYDPPRIELKPFRGSILDEEDILNPNPMDEDVQVMVRPPQVKMEVGLAMEQKPAFTSKFKFLEAIKSLVISLDTPTLSRILSKIEQKIWEIGQSNNRMSNDEMIPVMDLLVARIANHSVFDLPECVESVSFKEFLCYLKAVILSLKLEGLEVILEKIKEKNKEVAVKDKRIPVEKVVSVLHHTLDVI